MNGDGVSDILIGAPSVSDPARSGGAAYLFFGDHLEDADAADGTIDGLIEITNANASVADGFAGYVFLGTVEEGHVGFTVAPVEDFNGDGLADIVIGGGETRLIYGSELENLDAVDGIIDGEIDLATAMSALGVGVAGYTFVGTQAFSNSSQ